MTGMIYTFYSYKGGVGRSMALANIAMYFYKLGYTTLLVDWDLEAPGLERYFEDRYKFQLGDVIDRPGLCDMLRQYLKNAETQIINDPEAVEKTLYPAVEDYLYPLDSDENHRLLLLHAGRRTEGKPWHDYASFVTGFDWASFYEEWEGGSYLEWLRHRFKEIADVILIDSRTGVTEMGGVATQHLSDVVIMMTGANLQNIENTARMARNFCSATVQESRNDRTLEILLVPSRIDDADSDGYGTFVDHFNEICRDIQTPVLSDGYNPIEMLVPYLPAFSFQERIIFDDSEAEKTARRLTEAYRRIAANMQLLAHENTVLKNAPPSSPLSRSVFLGYTIQDTESGAWFTDYLIKQGFEVRQGGQNRSETVEIDFNAELASVICVVILITGSTSASRFITRLTYSALDTGKPIIPVLVEDVSLPLNLTTLQHLNLIQRTPENLYRLNDAIDRFSKPRQEITKAETLPDDLIFISSISNDNSQVNQLYQGLKQNGLRVWMASYDLMPGEIWDVAIQQVIDNARVVVPILTAESIKSRQLRSEWSYAVTHNKLFLPVMFEDVATTSLFFDVEPIKYTGNMKFLVETVITRLNALLNPDTRPLTIEQQIEIEEVPEPVNMSLPQMAVFNATKSTSTAVISDIRRRSQTADFRREEVIYIMQRWRAGDSVSLVGIGSVGKSNLLQHLADPDIHRYYLGLDSTDKFKVILIDPNMMTSLTSEASEQALTWAGYELLLNRLYLAMYPFNQLSNDDASQFYEVYQALQDATNPVYTVMGFRYFELALSILFRYAIRIIFMFDEFEELFKKMPVQFFQQLRGLRDANQQLLDYLTFTRTPLKVLVEQFEIPALDIEPFTELFTDNILYVGPYNETDGRRMVETLMSRNQKQYPEAAIRFLMWATGRYAGLLRAAFRMVDTIGEINEASLLNDELASRLANKRPVQEECRTIWMSLTLPEQHVLKAAARLVTFSSNTETDQAVAMLVQKRLLAADRMQQTLEIQPPVFRAFVATNPE